VHQYLQARSNNRFCNRTPEFPSGNHTKERALASPRKCPKSMLYRSEAPDKGLPPKANAPAGALDV
jgi:hypothetical protein